MVKFKIPTIFRNFFVHVRKIGNRPLVLLSEIFCIFLTNHPLTLIMALLTSTSTSTCKDCRTIPALRMDDVRMLYNPMATAGNNPLLQSDACGQRVSPVKGLSCGKTFGKCRVVCTEPRQCCDQFKCYWKPNCPVALIRMYEDQPWFRNRVVQSEWRNFVGQLVTPANIGCQACPGPEDWQFKCHKVRALIGPQVPCVWELPEQDKCCCTQYGINRDWRRYNEDQRMWASDICCGCNDRPICRSNKPCCEWPPYLGSKYGGRYMAWGHPSKMGFPRPQVFNYQSLPKC